MKALIPLALVATLTACVEPAPLVTDFNGDSVKIQTTSIKTGKEQALMSLPEANRICATKGKKAQYASSSTNQQTYAMTHLFLCL